MVIYPIIRVTHKCKHDPDGSFIIQMLKDVFNLREKVTNRLSSEISAKIFYEKEQRLWTLTILTNLGNRFVTPSMPGKPSFATAICLNTSSNVCSYELARRSPLVALEDGKVRAGFRLENTFCQTRLSNKLTLLQFRVLQAQWECLALS